MTKLVRSVNEADGTHYGVPEDADLYCFYYDDICRQAGAAALFCMGERIEGRSVFEIAVFVRNDMRRQGVCGLLLKELKKYVKGSVVRFAVYENDTAGSVMEKLGAVHDHDELMLSACTKQFYDRGYEDRITVTIDAEDGKAVSPYGECYFRSSKDTAYVFGVHTFANFRRNGYAASMLGRLFGYLYEKGTERVFLQVSSENLPALGLYEKLGMKETDRLSYYTTIWQ